MRNMPCYTYRRSVCYGKRNSVLFPQVRGSVTWLQQRNIEHNVTRGVCNTPCVMPCYAPRVFYSMKEER
jgi:hypothetical protein